MVYHVEARMVVAVSRCSRGKVRGVRTFNQSAAGAGVEGRASGMANAGRCLLRNNPPAWQMPGNAPTTARHPGRRCVSPLSWRLAACWEGPACKSGAPAANPIAYVSTMRAVAG